MQFELFQRGDLVWDYFGAQIMPDARQNIKRILHVSKDLQTPADVQARYR